MVSIKSSMPVPLKGRRAALILNSSFSQVNAYLKYFVLTNSQLWLEKNVKIMFASTSLKGNAENWCFMPVHSSRALVQ